MLANMFVFNARSATDPTGSAYAVLMQVGSYRVTSFSLIMGVLSALIVVPVNVLVVALFAQRGRRNAVRATMTAPSNQQSIASCPKRQPKNAEEQDEWDEALEDTFEDMLEEELKKSGGWRQKVGAMLGAVKVLMFPFIWWSHYVGYVLAFASIAVATWAIVCFGGGLGEELATEWVVTMLLSILKSVLVIQPVKVYLLL